DDAGGSEDTAGGRVVLGTTEADAMGRGAAVAGGSAAAIVVSGPARGGVSTGAGRRITTTTPPGRRRRRPRRARRGARSALPVLREEPRRSGASSRGPLARRRAWARPRERSAEPRRSAA